MRMAESSVKKETIMRRKDFSGAQEWMGADELIKSLIVWMLSARNISGSLRLVIRRVFEGGVGWTRGGRLERSIDIGLDLRDDGRERGGEVGDDGELSDDILAVLLYSRGLN